MVNFIKSLGFIVIFFVTTAAMGQPIRPNGGDVVNNAAGLSENNIMYAWMNLQSYVESCVYSKGCQLSLPEYDLLEKIYKNHPAEIRGAGIRFLSSKANPGTFDLDESGTPRTGVTGSQVGSPIYFNIERLYPVVDGKEQAIDTMTAVGFLVHELGHHHGITDHTYLDRLGGKVKNFISSQRLLTADLRKFKNNPFSISVFSTTLLHEVNLIPIIGVRAQVSVSNGYEVFDLSSYFKTPSRCNLKPEDIESSATDLTLLPLPAFNKLENNQTIKFQVVVNWDCNPWPMPGIRKHFNQTLEVENKFAIKNLYRINLFDWKLEDSTFDPPSWRSQDNIILHPINKWSVKEVLCEKTDFSFNPIGPCDF